MEQANNVTPPLPDYATNIALIRNGEVVNVIWGMFYSQEEYEQEGCIAVAYDDLAVQIGCTYEDGVFYDEYGDRVKTIEEIHDEELAELDEYIIEMEYQYIINADDEEEV